MQLLLPALLLGVASATLIGVNVGEAVLSIPGAEWEQALNRPNATGHFPIVGYNVSQPINSATLIDGWSLDFNITADISTANRTIRPGVQLPNDTGSYVTGASIRLNAPPSLLTTTANGSTVVKFDNNTWSICATWLFLERLPQETIDAGKNDNGSCTSMFGEQCVLDIRSSWARRFTKRTCGPATLPGSCRKAIPSLNAFSFGIYPHDPKFIGGNIAEISSDVVHPLGNTTDYHRLGGQSYPVIISWVPRSRTGGFHHVTLACVKANQALNGSQLPGGTSAANRLGSMSGSILVFLFAMLWMT